MRSSWRTRKSIIGQITVKRFLKSRAPHHIGHDGSNYRANQRLCHLFKRNERRNGNVGHCKQVVREALQIYHAINEPLNHFVINTICKILYHFNCPEEALSLWDDISLFLNSPRNNQRDVSYPLLINLYGHCSLSKSV